MEGAGTPREAELLTVLDNSRRAHLAEIASMGDKLRAAEARIAELESQARSALRGTVATQAPVLSLSFAYRELQARVRELEARIVAMDDERRTWLDELAKQRPVIEAVREWVRLADIFDRLDHEVAETDRPTNEQLLDFESAENAAEAACWHVLDAAREAGPGGE